MKLNRKTVILLVITMMWMTVIFRMSAAPAAESSETSESVGKIICGLFIPDYDELSVEEQTNMAKAIDHPVRKAAHVTEYLILGILMALLFVSADKANNRNRYSKISFFVKPFTICALYAASDEFHQLFVPGRSGQVKDILIDSCGILIGTVIIWIVSKTSFHHISHTQVN